jgi:O-antigen/teichoic acid export membrane protein
VAYTIAMMLTMFSGSMTQSLIPAFSQLQAGADRERLSQLYARCIRLTAIVFFPAVMLVAIAARPFLTVWAGEEFGRESVGPLYVLLAGLLLNAVAFFPASIVVSAGRTDTMARLYWVELVMYIPLAFWLVSAYGAIGAATAWSIRVIADAAAFFFLAGRISGVSIGRFSSAAFAALGILALPIILINYFDTLSVALAVCVVAAYAAYALIVWSYLLTGEETAWVRTRIHTLMPSRSEPW